jgi:hypothetical protein
MTRYLQLRETLLAHAREDLRRYLTGIDRIISGHINLATTAIRYRDPETVHLVTRVDKPSDPSIAPLRIPTIAWWWDHLDTCERQRAATEDDPWAVTPTEETLPRSTGLRYHVVRTMPIQISYPEWQPTVPVS